MKLFQSRIVGVQSDAQHVDIQIQLAGSEDTSKPLTMTVKPGKFGGQSNKVHVVKCEFTDLPQNKVVATRREFCANGMATITIAET